MVLRDRFEMLFEHNLDAVFFMTLDEPFAWRGAADQEALLDYAFDHLRVTAVNPAMCEQMRASREQLIGSVPRARWHLDPRTWRKKMRELYDNGRMFHRMRAPRSDGSWMDIEGEYVCTYDEQGRITGHFGTQRDVTERRRAADRLELAMSGGDVGIWDLDLKTLEIFFDEAWIRRLGYSPDDPNTRSGAWWGLVVTHPEDIPEIRRSFEAHLSGERAIHRVEHRVRTASGELLWLLSSGRVHRDAHGNPARLIGLSVDITEKRRATERLELLMLGGDINVWEFDLVNNRMTHDPVWVRKLGYSPDDPRTTYTKWWEDEAIHPADLPQMRANLEAHIVGAAPVYRAEHRIRTAAGEWLWLLSTGIVYRDAGGRPARLVAMSLDITERKLLQERLFLTERMASIGTLAAGVGHEINNPLTYIVLNLALIEREIKAALPAEAQPRVLIMLEQARYGSERVSAIVRDLQALTRVPDERIGLVDLVAVIERCLEIADHQIRHRAHVIRELAPVRLVRGSEGRIVQLFLNLIVNAAQAIAEGAADRHWVRVTTTMNDSRVRVEIADNGSGIPAAVMGRIFDPFFTTKPVGEGSGLGLAICRNILTALGGDIEVDSAVGCGTTFRVCLPAATTEGDAEEVPAVAAAQATTAKRVLVIDDEPMVGHLVEKVLDGHHVTAETSAARALARLRAGERFDRILCDVMMPEITGMEFFEALSEVAPEQRDRVVFLSGGVFTERARLFLDSVPNRRLHKPFGLAALTAVLAE